MRNLKATILTMVLAAGAALASPVALAAPCPPVAQGARVGVAPPPPLRREIQPPMPAYGYVWTPGYWGWNGLENDYYWIPGVWILPPAIDLLWTPPWWGWVGGVYVLTPGYWGPFVGFYGGIDYGFGYDGFGYQGGYWRGRTIYYNRAVNNLGGLRVNAVYDRPVRANRAADLVSYNGGARGVRADPTAAQRAAMSAPHRAATAAQATHRQQAALARPNRAAARATRSARGTPTVRHAAARSAASHGRLNARGVSHARATRSGRATYGRREGASRSYRTATSGYRHGGYAGSRAAMGGGRAFRGAAGGYRGGGRFSAPRGGGGGHFESGRGGGGGNHPHR